MFLPETPASPSPLYMNLLLSVLNHAENIHLLTPHHNIWVGVRLYDIFPGGRSHELCPEKKRFFAAPAIFNFDTVSTVSSFPVANYKINVPGFFFFSSRRVFS